MSAAVYNNKVFLEGVQRMNHVFTIENYGHLNLSEDERCQVYDLSQDKLELFLSLNGSLAGFNAEAAVRGCVENVVSMRTPQAFPKIYAPEEWRLE